MKLRTFLTLLVAAPVVLLSACGHGDGGNGTIRLVNGTTNALDLYENGALLTSNVAANSAGAYAAVASGSNTFSLSLHSATNTALVSTVRATAKDVAYSLLAYTTADSLRTVLLTDAQLAPPAGSSYLRVYNASVEAGSVDVYITQAVGTAANALASNPTKISPPGGLGTERFTVYNQVSAGTYRIIVTGAGSTNASDVRLDTGSTPNVVFTDQQIATLALTKTPGGALVNGLVVTQGSQTASSINNPSLRVRLVADVTGNGNSAIATINGTAVSGTVTSPGVGTYTLAPATGSSSSVTVGGVTVPVTGLPTAAGSDVTLLVYGAPGAPTVSVIVDDNSPPDTTANAKIRLVHGLNNLNSTLGLQAGGLQVASGITIGTASLPYAVPGNSLSDQSTSTLDVLSSVPGFLNPYEISRKLPPGSVWTVWMLGDANGTPVGRLTQDR